MNKQTKSIVFFLISVAIIILISAIQDEEINNQERKEFNLFNRSSLSGIITYKDILYHKSAFRACLRIFICAFEMILVSAKTGFEGYSSASTFKKSNAG